MTSVFGAFILGNDPIIKLFGVALSTAVLLDAFIVRLIFIPSLMTILGKKNWWMPAWLDKVLPHVSVESEEDIEAGASEIEDIPDPGRAGAGKSLTRGFIAPRRTFTPAGAPKSGRAERNVGRHEPAWERARS